MEMIPAIESGAQSPALSSRYRFVDTKPLIQALMSEGFDVTEAMVIRSRKRAPESAKHLVRLRHRESPLIHGVFPEIGILNSHDGSSGAVMFAGMFRLVCSNGLIIMSQQFAPTIRIKHVGSAVEQAMQGAIMMGNVGKELSQAIPQFHAKRLSEHEQQDFAKEAMKMANFPDDQRTADQLLRVRRPEDMDNSLWCTYNRVQENLLGGGVDRRTQHGGMRMTSRVRSIDRTYGLNTKLWALMEEFATR